MGVAIGPAGRQQGDPGQGRRGAFPAHGAAPLRVRGALAPGGGSPPAKCGRKALRIPCTGEVSGQGGELQPAVAVEVHGDRGRADHRCRQHREPAELTAAVVDAGDRTGARRREDLLSSVPVEVGQKRLPLGSSQLLVSRELHRKRRHPVAVLPQQVDGGSGGDGNLEGTVAVDVSEGGGGVSSVRQHRLPEDRPIPAQGGDLAAGVN